MVLKQYLNMFECPIHCSFKLNACTCTSVKIIIQVLQECFESKDISMLQTAVAAMPEEEAAYHIKRCVESGLWVPEGGKAPATEASEEGIYDEPTHSVNVHPSDDVAPSNRTDEEKLSLSIDDVD